MTTLADPAPGGRPADAVIAVREGEMAAVDGLDDGRIAAAHRWRY